MNDNTIRFKIVPTTKGFGIETSIGGRPFGPIDCDNCDSFFTYRDAEKFCIDYAYDKLYEGYEFV